MFIVVYPHFKNQTIKWLIHSVLAYQLLTRWTAVAGKLKK